MDYKLIISIYASVISTIVFVWRLYEFYYDRRGRLKITLKTVSKTPVNVAGIMGNLEIFLIVTVVNIGKNKRHIEEPQFFSNSKIKKNKHFNILDFKKTKNFPISLEPGEKFEYPIPYSPLEDDFKEKNITKIKALVFDTLRKKYSSTWFNI